MMTTRRAVHDQHFRVADQLPRIVRGDHGGHVEAARNDGRMRRRSAHVGQKRAVVMMLELDDVGRRQVVGDQDRLFFRDRCG